MWIIKPARLRQFWEQHPDCEASLKAWLGQARKAEWEAIQEVRGQFPAADAVKVASGGIVTVFNIAGNKYRLLTAIHYNTGRLFVLDLLTHADYSKDRWKDRL